jgi:hypothetical protein
VRLPVAVETIEGALIPHLTYKATDREADPLGSFKHEVSDRFLEMDMLMRIEVRGIPTDEGKEGVQLSIDFRRDCIGISDRDAYIARSPGTVPVGPLGEV